MSDDELQALIREIRMSRNIKRPAAVTHKAAEKRTSKLKDLLSGLSKEELGALLKAK